MSINIAVTVVNLEGGTPFKDSDMIVKFVTQPNCHKLTGLGIV